MPSLLALHICSELVEELKKALHRVSKSNLTMVSPKTLRMLYLHQWHTLGLKECEDLDRKVMNFLTLISDTFPNNNNDDDDVNNFSFTAMVHD